MYQQQQNPIDDKIAQHTHGVSDEQSKKLELKKFGYYYKDSGEIVYSKKQQIKNKADRARQLKETLSRGVDPRFK